MDFDEVVLPLIGSFLGYLLFDFLSDELFGWWPVVAMKWACLVFTILFALGLVYLIIDHFR